MEKIGTLLSQRDQTDIIRIGVLPIDGFALMSYASTVEPFRAANMLSRRMLYEVVNISPSLELVSSSGAASVAPDITRAKPAFFQHCNIGDPIGFGQIMRRR